MYPDQFRMIHNLIKPHIQKKKTNWRQTISTEKRLEVTLSHLATGESKRSLLFQYRVGRFTLTMIISHACKAIYYTLQPFYLPGATLELLKQFSKGSAKDGTFQTVLGP